MADRLSTMVEVVNDLYKLIHSRNNVANAAYTALLTEYGLPFDLNGKPIFTGADVAALPAREQDALRASIANIMAVVAADSADRSVAGVLAYAGYMSIDEAIADVPNLIASDGDRATMTANLTECKNLLATLDTVLTPEQLYTELDVLRAVGAQVAASASRMGKV